jgi:PAS domain S-box-containing protein
MDQCQRLLLRTCIWLLLFCLPVSIFAATTGEPDVLLTQEETAWVNNLTVPLKVANEMDWPPFDFLENGEPKGFSIDLIRMVSAKVGINIEFINGFTWAELIKKFKTGEIDIMPAIYKTPERQEIISYTSSYVTNASVLVLNEKTKGIEDLTDLEGKNVAVVDEFTLNQIMKDRYPGIKQQKVTNVLEGLKSVSLGKTDAFIGSLGNISYILDKNFIPDLRIAKEIWLQDPDEATLYMGVAKENVILRDILEKGLSALSKKELNDIRKRWLSRAVGDQTFDMSSILTDKETKWLSEHRTFRLGIDQAWPPFEFLDSKGHYSGIGSSYVKAVEERLDITMKPLQGLSWPQVISKAQMGEVDILPAVVRTDAGEKYLNYTKPYISLPIVIASRKDAPYIEDLSDLAGLKVGVAKDYTIIDLLEQDSSNLYLVLHGTLAKGLEELNAGRTDVFIDNLGSITYEMDRNNLTNIKIAAPTKYNLEISMGVRKDWPEMVGIINKTLDSMSDQEHAVIKNTWMALEVKFGFDLKAMLIWIIPIAGSVILVIFFVLVWNRRLSLEVNERKEKEKLIKLGAQISQSLTVVATLKETLQSITDIFVKELNVAFARIWIVDETDNVLKLQASSGLYTHIEGAHERVPIGGDTKIGRIVAEQQPQMSNNIQESPYVEDKEWAREQGLTSFAGIPMIVEGRSVGALVLFSHEPIQEDTMPTILSTADSIAVAIERNHAEETALASERKIRAMSASSLDALIMIDRKANIIFWNPAAERIFGYNAEEVMGRNLHELIVPVGERALASEGMAGFVQTGEGKVIGQVFEQEALRNDGSTFPAEIAVSALQMENEWYAVGSVRDISDRKQAEEELQQHLQDLKQFERLAVGREERMIDLKAQVNDLLQAMGQAKKYKIV